MSINRRNLIKGMAVLSAGSAFMPSVFAASLEEIQKKGVIQVVTEDNYQPFNYMDGDKPTGFNNELLEDFKKYCPFEVHQEIIPWTGLLAGISAGKFDVGLTGALMTPERLKTFDFTPPYAGGADYAIIRAGDKDKIKDVADLEGLTLGVQAGSALLARLPELETMLKEKGKKMGDVVQYTSYPEAVADLANGRLDYVVDVYLSAKMLQQKRPNVFAMGVPVSGPNFVAWPIKKNNPTLMAFLVKFMNEVRSSGRLAELQKKWYGEEFPDLPTTAFTSPEQFGKATGWVA